MTRTLSRTLRLRLLVSALATALALAGAEVVFRWHVKRTFDREFPPWTENLLAIRGPQVFEFKPNASGVFPGNVDQNRTFPYRTNSHGLRDRPPKTAGALRVLVIGDSYTWGYAVAGEEAFPQVAERILRARGAAGAEVVNGGIPDYNSRQKRQLLERLLPIYQPDAVVLAYVVNDAEPSTAMPTPPEETYRHSRSWFLTELAEVANRRLFRRKVFVSAKDTVSGTYLEGFAESSHKWRDSKQAIREMRDLCVAAGLPFTILMLPDFTLDFDERYVFRPIHEAVVSWGRELNVPAYDLLPPFMGQDHQALWVPWDGHPNAEAHRRMAELLVARIEDDPRLGPAGRR